MDATLELPRPTQPISAEASLYLRREGFQLARGLVRHGLSQQEAVDLLASLTRFTIDMFYDSLPDQLISDPRLTKWEKHELIKMEMRRRARIEAEQLGARRISEGRYEF